MWTRLTKLAVLFPGALILAYGTKNKVSMNTPIAYAATGDKYGFNSERASVSPAAGQRESALERYEVDEAYRFYEAILPNEESYPRAKTLVIQLETGSSPGKNTTGCLSEDAARKFKTAALDYSTVNHKGWTLVSKLKLDKPYKFISSKEIQQHFNKPGIDGWTDFYKQHPDSFGFVTLSAVGFNEAKTLAVVHAYSRCGGLCGHWQFHLLEKTGGTWKESIGVTCFGWN